ncbi:MAG: glycoside hydrolase family 15 protein [Scytonema sp. PMC 1069.18]|nr:glycoside hydrolase family 15 protein [Scytonema sp. PMC 1069.18]MEC4884082.1 glycoside hydrolase family 15 protein [Scytonema sp. PMC 1070.18]
MSITSHSKNYLIQPTSSFPPIEDYGIIGNCHTAALVNSHGSIDWLCLPRFDSPSLFARILDIERGGAWSIQPTTAYKSTHHYLDETNILETIFTCESGQISLFDFMDITGNEQQQNLAAPGRLIRIVECVKGTVEIVSTCTPRPNYAREIPQFVTSGTEVSFGSFTVTSPAESHIDTTTNTLRCCITLHAGEKVAFTLLTKEDIELPHPAPNDALASTITFWQHWVSKCTYHGPYRHAVVRSALALKLMIYDPTGAIVAAPTTSLPEEIGGERNWDYRFTWIRDSSFTLYALLLAGYFDDEHPFFDWLVHTVKIESSGIKILYPITSKGQLVEQTLENLRGYCNSQPVRIGNGAATQVQLDVYGEVLSALHFAWKVGKYDPTSIWTHIRPLLDWVADHWREPGSGIWEVRGGFRHFVYGKVMLWVALDSGIEMAVRLNLPGDIDRWRREREFIRNEVFEKGWSDKLGAFKQSYEDENLDASNLLLSSVGFIDGTDPRMMSTIDATIKHLVSNGLCYRYRDAPEGVHGQESSFVICTFWLINALILAGRTGEARVWYEQMLARSTPLGLFAEEIDPETGAQRGNFPQALSHIGVINVAVSLAHAGHAGTVQPHHANSANAAKRGGGGFNN